MWAALLDFVFPAQCAGCSVLGSGLCEECAPARAVAVRVRLPALSIVAYGAYEGVLRAAVLALKDGRRDVARALGERIAPLLVPGSLLVPVPTTARRRRTRGIDGVALVAQRAAQLCGAGVVCALEQRSGDAQRGRSRSERLAARERFACRAGALEGRHVTLVDDVCTTGATLEDCRNAELRAGGRVAGAVVVAATKTGPAWRPPQRG